MDTVFAWFSDPTHLAALTAAFSAFVAVVYAGEKLAALTANKTDDAIFGFLHKVVSYVALQLPSKPADPASTPPAA